VRFVIPIQDLILLPGAEGLMDLPPDVQKATISALFPFLPDGTTFTIENGEVTIEVPGAGLSDVTEAERLAAKAEKRAQNGEFAKAKPIYERVLQLNPVAIEPRRNLAMVCYELGEFEEAKDHLIEVLRLDPSNAWSFVILGNIYSRTRNDGASASKFFRKALELKPGDPWALNGLGAVHCESGEFSTAIDFFDQAIRAEPRFANAYLGRAMAWLRMNRSAEAAQTLESLFAHGELLDARTRPVLTEARSMYLRVQTQVANDRVSDSFKVVENLKAEAARVSGFPVRVEEARLDARIAGMAQMAWKYGRDYHRLVLREGNATPEILKHHVSAHELQHVLMEAAARAAGTNRWFSTTETNREAALRAVSRDIEKLERKGYDGHKLTEMVRQILSGACGFLFNCPLDMIIETRLRREFPNLRSAQFCGISQLVQDARTGTFNEEVRKITPAAILRINDALNGAYALFADDLFGGATAFAAPYRNLPAFPQAQKLLAIWHDMTPDTSPGAEYAIVDAFASELQVTDWYSWKADPGDHHISDSLATAKEGPTNPALLRDKAPATVLYLLDALRRFGSMAPEAIRQVMIDTAMAGMNGLDYASPEKKYRLKAFPDEAFSGLQMMAFLYAAGQRVAPGESMGMDFNEEYLRALRMFEEEGD
jgi:tetratricopeptide (TPR) repeat protein